MILLFSHIFAFHQTGKAFPAFVKVNSGEECGNPVVLNLQRGGV